MAKNKKFIGVRVDEDLYDQLRDEASADDRSVNYVVERFLKEGVKHLLRDRQNQHQLV